MDHAQRTVLSSHRRRQRRRAAVTLTLVGLVMVGTFAYAAAYFQGWVAFGTPPPVASPACQVAAPAKVVTPGAVTINVYNATNRKGWLPPWQSRCDDRVSRCIRSPMTHWESRSPASAKCGMDSPVPLVPNSPP